ncbi:unnamed protein product [Diatraea saccharalis]|uniref:Major facilitator superfamily (MFS) profile domain-containing protein n=1 Tax=Diatraea saccharalis TaxID=40085 RepID=A0A9N9R1A1_9NEOP|nr:unnamed protein product [Diatraea saccharalis]
MVCLPLTGFISDRWGRRIAVAFSAFNACWLGATRYFANTYIVFVFLQFLESSLGNGAYTACFILLMEIVGPKYRVIIGTLTQTFFSVGQVTVGLIAWVVPDWRNLTLIIYLPQIISVSYLWIMTESIRWHMSKGRYDKSEETLRKMAKANGKVLSQKSLDALKNSAQEFKIKQDMMKENMKNEPWLIAIVFQHKAILVRCIVSPILWVTMTFVYYGMSINAVNLSGNRYLNYVAVSMVQIPGYWTAMFLLDRIGRRPVLMGAYWICAICLLAYIFVPEGQYVVSLCLYLIGSYCSATVVTALYIYTTELYPTKYRHRLFAFSSAVGRIGSLLAPLSPALVNLDIFISIILLGY